MVESKATAVIIIKDLLNNNVCKYCSLRYINVKKPEAYVNIDQYLKDLSVKNDYDEDCIPAAKQMKTNPCSACLGLLQISENNDFLDKISAEVKNANYDCDDVTFALSLPITILLRDYSVWLYVSDKYRDFYSDPFNPGPLKRANNMVSIKDIWKWCAAQTVSERINKKLNNGVDGNFHVNIHIEYEKDSTETDCLLEMFPNIFKCRSSQKRKFHGEILTRKSVESALVEVSLKLFKTYYPVPPEVPDCFVKCGNIECVHDSIYIAGRYNKFSRSLSQTPWLINGERRMESSVEEIIGTPVSKVILNSGVKFSSSGREDVDVRTLGKGRPFVLEVTNPRKIKLNFQTMREIENDINQSTNDVFVRDLQIVSKEDLVYIKMGEQSKTKTYTCYCITELVKGESLDVFKDKLEGLSKINNLIVEQKTPIRVLHRRSLAIRPRTVFWLKANFHQVKGDKVFFMLSLQVEAGTYIKEFVHGDFGRTKPNVSSILGKETDILALDVEEVALQWPPSIDYGAKPINAVKTK